MLLFHLAFYCLLFDWDLPSPKKQAQTAFLLLARRLRALGMGATRKTTNSCTRIAEKKMYTIFSVLPYTLLWSESFSKRNWDHPCACPRDLFFSGQCGTSRWKQVNFCLIPRTARFTGVLMRSRNASLSCGLTAEAVCLPHSFPILPTMPLFPWNAAVMSGRDCRRCSLGQLGPLPSSIVKPKTKTKTLNLSWYSAGWQCNEQSFGVIGFQQPVLRRR